MTKDILVRVRGTQTIGEEEDTVEMITPGTYYEKNGKQYFIYDESLDETGEPTHNTVKIMENRIEVTKRGLDGDHNFVSRDCGGRGINPSEDQIFDGDERAVRI